MNNLFDIEGNVTVITGGTGVLGRAIAKYLALNGARVIIMGRKEDVGNQIAADIRAEGGECEFMKTDVLNVEVVRKNCEEILAKYGRVDTLLNAAGGNMPGATIPPEKTFFDLQVDQFQTVLLTVQLPLHHGADLRIKLRYKINGIKRLSVHMILPFCHLSLFRFLLYCNYMTNSLRSQQRHKCSCIFPSFFV